MSECLEASAWPTIDSWLLASIFLAITGTGTIASKPIKIESKRQIIYIRNLLNAIVSPKKPFCFVSSFIFTTHLQFFNKPTFNNLSSWSFKRNALLQDGRCSVAKPSTIIWKIGHEHHRTNFARIIEWILLELSNEYCLHCVKCRRESNAYQGEFIEFWYKFIECIEQNQIYLNFIVNMWKLSNA